MLCDEAGFKKKYKEMIKSEGMASAKEYKFKRNNKLKQKESIIGRKQSFAKFCKEQKENIEN